MTAKCAWDDCILAGTRFLAAVWVFGLLLVFLFYPPYWALMDDSGFVQAASESFEGINLWDFVAHFVKGDFSWGMFRPMYGIFIYLFYGTFWKSSQLAYLFLFFLNAAIFWTWACLFEQTLRLFLPKNKSTNVQIFRWFFLVFCFLFSPNYTLLFFASLQERLVLMFAALAYYGMLQFAQQNAFKLSGMICLIFGILLCLLSKASALFLIPPFIFWFAVLFLEKRNTQFLWLLFLMMIIGMGFGYGFHSIRRGYTDQYLVSAMWQHWVQFGGRLHKPLLICASAMVLTVFFWRKTNETRSLSCLYSLLFWPMAMFSFVFVMLPWRSVVNYYLIVPGGLFLSGCKLIICFLLWESFPQGKRKWLTLILLAVCIGTSIPCARKVWHNARQHHGTGETVQFLKEELRKGNLNGATIRMPLPCIEASSAVSLFVGQKDLVRVLSRNDAFLTESGREKRILILNGECTDVPPGFSTSHEIFSYHPWHVYKDSQSS